MSFSLLSAILDTEQAFLVTVLRTEGHTYRKTGAKALFELGEDTPRHGNLGSQCLDRDLIAWGGQAVESGTSLCRSIDLSDVTDVVFGYGAYCGGKLDVLIEPIRDHERTVYESLLEVLTAGQATRLVHDLRTGALRIEPLSVESARIPAEEETSSRIEEIWEVPMRVLLFGATPLAHTLVPQLQSLDFDPLVVDWRSSYLDKFGETSRCVLIERNGIAEALSDNACVLILSHVFEQDRDALGAALTSECAFVGMLSSRTRREMIFKELRELGVGSESLARVRSPLGLDIQSRTDPEIAVSILAELVQFRAGSGQVEPVAERPQNCRR